MLRTPGLPKSQCTECLNESQVDNYLRDLVKNMVYDLFTCMKCKTINPSLVYFCLNNHCYCSKCIVNKCLKCDMLSEFSDGKKLKNVNVTCDWLKCNESVTLDKYITHRACCASRPYKCPLKQCQVTVHSAAELQTHWHCKLPALISQKRQFGYDRYELCEFYLLLDKELYHVLIDFSKQKTDILIEEINVLPNNNTFVFNAYCNRYKKWDKPITLSNVGGKYKQATETSESRFEIERIRIDINLASQNT